MQVVHIHLSDVFFVSPVAEWNKHHFHVRSTCKYVHIHTNNTHISCMYPCIYTFTITRSFPLFLAYSFNASSRRLSIHLRIGSLVFSSVVSKTINCKKGADKLTFRSKRSCTNCDTHWNVALHDNLRELSLVIQLCISRLCSLRECFAAPSHSEFLGWWIWRLLRQRASFPFAWSVNWLLTTMALQDLPGPFDQLFMVICLLFPNCFVLIRGLSHYSIDNGNIFQTLPTPSISLSSHPPASEANFPIGRQGRPCTELTMPSCPKPSLTPCQSRPLKAPFPRRYGFLLSLCLSPCISLPESIFPWNSTNSTSNPTKSSNPNSSHLLLDPNQLQLSFSSSSALSGSNFSWAWITWPGFSYACCGDGTFRTSLDVDGLGEAVNKLAECPFEMASLVEELPMLLLWMVWAFGRTY